MSYKVSKIITLADLEYLTQEQASKWLGISRGTLIEYEKDGLKVIRKGGRVFYSKTEIKKYLSKYIA